MKTKVEKLEDNRVKLTVTIDAEEIDKRISKTYKDFAYKYSFPGFRKGRAPRPVIDNALGSEAVTATVTEELVKDSYPLALDESGIYAISNPVFDDQDDLVEAGKDYTFSYTVEVKPELELNSYDPVELVLPTEGASDAEVELQIESLREHYYEYADAPAKTKISEDGHADLAIKATDAKGNPIEDLENESRFYSIGSGLFPESFDKELVGMKKGDKKTIDINIKDDLVIGLTTTPEMGDVAHVDVEVLNVKQKEYPELTDEWAKDTLGFEGVADLKERIAESIVENKNETIPKMRENQSLYELADRLEGEVPEALVESSETDLLQSFFRQLQSQGMSLDAYITQQGITIEKFQEDIKLQAADICKQDLALDAWARHRGVTVSDEDVIEEFRKSGAEDPEELEKEWRESGRINILKENILRVKALDDVLETALVKEIDTTDIGGEEEDDSKKSSKTTSKKPSGKKADEKVSDDKTAGKKADSKKSSKDADEKKDSEKKPADKKATSKKDDAK